ncbi:GDSL-type esterase/lipase family protein [Crocosphaera sp.]|uniref:GDSL-type esterase/lipase family protein n=1 Tax=Crocosphaera sp. TaxID=2729996 RepID=UPI002631E44D|nr:GDSL-type esterase/lipase family protein [Crocosphaera sp.]MDJ0582238.1 GDSL-type esterase/lipase family protein [Crocosphaera sp.]
MNSFIAQFQHNTYQKNYYINNMIDLQQQTCSSENIVFLGDSLTEYGEWKKLFNNEQIINQGIGGDTTAGVLNRIDETIITQPKKIFIMIGVNDLGNERITVDEIIMNYKKILTLFQEQTPETEVYIQSVLPINNRDYNSIVNNQDVINVNEQLKKLARQFKYQYIDLHRYFIDEENQLKPKYTNDGVHLNEQGYNLWAEKIYFSLGS